MRRIRELPLTVSARDAAEAEARLYLDDIRDAAERIARREDLDVVSSVHVRRAKAQLRDTGRVDYRPQLVLAGSTIALTLAASTLLSAVRSEVVSTSQLIQAVALAVVGVALTAVLFVRRH